jgi:hypothetical protein
MWVCAVAYLSQARYFSQGVHPLSGRAWLPVREIARAGVSANAGAGQSQEFMLLTFNVSTSNEEYWGR